MKVVVFYIPTSSQLSPCLGEGHAKRSEEGEDGAQEDGTAATNPIVEGIGDPSGARRCKHCIHDEKGDG
jgi:hypothetical protein